MQAYITYWYYTYPVIGMQTYNNKIFHISKKKSTKKSLIGCPRIDLIYVTLNKK